MRPDFPQTTLSANQRRVCDVSYVRPPYAALAGDALLPETNLSPLA